MTTTELWRHLDDVISWRSTGSGWWWWTAVIDSDTASEWVLSQQRLGTLELGPERPEGTLPWCQINTNTAHWRTGDLLRAEQWNVKRYFGVEERWSRNLSSWCKAVIFLQSPVNKTEWAGLMFVCRWSFLLSVMFLVRLKCVRCIKHLFWFLVLLTFDSWSSATASVQTPLKNFGFFI